MSRTCTRNHDSGGSAFVAAGLVMVPLWRLGRERSLLWLNATGFVLGWVLVGVAMLGWRWAAIRPWSASTARRRAHGGVGGRRAARARLSRGVLVVAGLGRCGAAAAGGARCPDRARRWGPGVVRSRRICAGDAVWRLPSTGPLLAVLAADSARCGCRGDGPRNGCCPPRSQPAGALPP